jgi:hypothetical protein
MSNTKQLAAEVAELRAAVEEIRHLVLGANHSAERYPRTNAVLVAWECPINMDGCVKNCGSYGCGN